MKPVRHRSIQSMALAVLLIAAASAVAAVDVRPSFANGSVRFAVIGDSGTGSAAQYEIGRRLAESREIFPFDFVLMMGDNLYGAERPQDYVQKFERPYAPLLDAKVRFFALDSNYMDRDQLQWLERELQSASEPWTIAFFHHPLYSSGARHGPQVDLRQQVEPLFLQYGVDVVFTGHEHFYERLKPQKGISYFISGGAAKVRKGDIRSTDITAAGLDRDNSFMLIEIAGDVMYFQTLSRTGRRVDAGEVRLAPS